MGQAMHLIDLKDAETQLAKLLEEAARGEDVIITRSDGTSFRIVLVTGAVAAPKLGSAKRFIKMSDDFDTPIEAFYAYAPIALSRNSAIG